MTGKFDRFLRWCGYNSAAVESEIFRRNYNRKYVTEINYWDGQIFFKISPRATTELKLTKVTDRKILIGTLNYHLLAKTNTIFTDKPEFYLEQIKSMLVKEKCTHSDLFCDWLYDVSREYAICGLVVKLVTEGKYCVIEVLSESFKFTFVDVGTLQQWLAGTNLTRHKKQIKPKETPTTVVVPPITFISHRERLKKELEERYYRDDKVSDEIVVCFGFKLDKLFDEELKNCIITSINRPNTLIKMEGHSSGVVTLTRELSLSEQGMETVLRSGKRVEFIKEQANEIASLISTISKGLGNLPEAIVSWVTEQIARNPTTLKHYTLSKLQMLNDFVGFLSASYLEFCQKESLVQIAIRDAKCVAGFYDFGNPPISTIQYRIVSEMFELNKLDNAIVVFDITGKLFNGECILLPNETLADMAFLLTFKRPQSNPFEIMCYFDKAKFNRYCIKLNNFNS